MSVFFGTDGLRGKVGQELNFDVAFKCGNSLSQMMKGCGRVVIGRDTRTSGPYLVSAIASGLMAGGISVDDAGIVPTAAISYLTKNYDYDYGIVITASHNPSEFNGIKIFSKEGIKIKEVQEEEIERGFIKTRFVDFDKIGVYKQKPILAKKYMNYLYSSASICLCGMKIVIDASNGAGYKIAPKVLKSLGARIFKTNCSNKGNKINDNCGSLHLESLINKVLKTKADFGFAFDGDADRIIAVDKNGNIIDGDMIIFALAKHYKEMGELIGDAVVGTSQTNMGIERALEEQGIKLLRADVGDKYVISMMNKNNLCLGGEQSGHIILQKFLPTGDGVLTAIQLACACRHKNKELSELCKVSLYPQTNISIEVKEKLRILGSETLSNAISNTQQELAGDGRVLVRASGTEPKIRIMVEANNDKVAKSLAEYLKEVVLSLEGKEWYVRNCLCCRR